MNKHIKIFKSPGLISVLFLLMLCFLFFNKYKVFEKQHGIELRLPETKFIPFEFNPDNIHLRREFTTITLNGNDFSDNVKINFSQQLLHNLAIKNDTVNGVHYIFTDKSKYKSLVRLFDILKLEKIRFYTLYNNDLWAFMMIDEPRKFEPVSHGHD